MCTVSLIARKDGYTLGMNRDEKRARVEGLPPARNQVNGRTAMFPCEPSGGTWIGVNDAAVTFALINWYAIATRVPSTPVSRGEVVRRLLGYELAEEGASILAEAPLIRINPFRLIGVFPSQLSVVEWRWNLVSLERISHPWETSIWISSGFDELGAQQARRTVFEEWRKDGKSDLSSIRALHSCHKPHPGPYSICMHRSDAATVSYTEVNVTKSSIEMAYAAGTPCVIFPHRNQSRHRILRARQHQADDSDIGMRG